VTTTPSTVVAALTDAGHAAWVGADGTVPATAVARLVAMAASGDVVGGPTVGVWVAAEWLALPDELRPGCPAVERERLDAWALEVTGWAAASYPITAAGKVRVGWLDRYRTGATEIDRRLFTALTSIAHAAFVDALTRIGRKAASATKDPRVAAAVAAVDPVDVPAVLHAHGASAVLAALTAYERDQTDAAVAEVKRRTRREIEAATLAVGALLATELGQYAADEWGSGQSNDANQAAEWLSVAMGALITDRVANPVQPDAGGTMSTAFPAALVWTAIGIAGGAALPSAAATAAETVGPSIAQGVRALGTIRKTLTAARDAVTTGVTRAQALVIAQREGLGTGLIDTAKAVLTGRATVLRVNTWHHVSSGTQFDPHARLDGVRDDRPDIESVLRVSGTFPLTGRYTPGDHAGCNCRWSTSWELVYTDPNDATAHGRFWSAA
jgi:hypothetical protein